MPSPDPDRPMPWVRSRAEREERERQAALLVGRRLAAVRYYAIDYERMADDPPPVGIRVVEAEDEWRAPDWRAADFDAIDYGIKLETSDGETFAAIWELRGDEEGLSLRRERLLGARLPADGAFAVWEVGATRLWAGCVGREVTGVELIWRRGRSLSCAAVVLRFGDRTRHLTLAEEDADGRYRPIADNLAVLDDAAARRYADGGFLPPDDAPA